MARGSFDTAAFFAALDAVRREREVTWKKMATESGISPSTLTRMAQGKRPDVDGLAALLRWSGLQADEYIRDDVGPRGETPTIARISTYLRADPHLTAQSAQALETIIEAAYRQMRQDQPDATRIQDRG